MLNVVCRSRLLHDIFVILDLSELPSFDEKKFKKFKIHAGKIFALHWVDEKSKHLLSCGAEGHMVYFFIICYL